jgi:hypothetical protein
VIYAGLMQYCRLINGNLLGSCAVASFGFTPPFQRNILPPSLALHCCVVWYFAVYNVSDGHAASIFSPGLCLAVCWLYSNVSLGHTVFISFISAGRSLVRRYLVVRKTTLKGFVYRNRKQIFQSPELLQQKT